MTDNKKKGGRPRLSKTEKKKFKLPPVRLGMLDYVTVKNRSKKAGLTMTEYQRQMLLNGQIVERVSAEQMELYRQLAGMGNNINQLAHQANKYGYYKDAEMYHENAMQVSNLINQILHDGKDNKRA
jgi:hypothetical protein|nr:MobC family plasmid mobilization relaxosome protein [uncultured Prevotella sp.]